MLCSNAITSRYLFCTSWNTLRTAESAPFKMAWVMNWSAPWLLRITASISSEVASGLTKWIWRSTFFLMEVLCLAWQAW